MFIEAIILIVLGGLIELDRTGTAQCFISEPVVVGPLAGLIAGDPMVGLKAGVILQMFFIGNVSIGGSIPTDGALAALVVVGSAGLCRKMGAVSPEALIGASALLFMIPASRLGRAVEMRMKERNVTLAHIADEEVKTGGAAAIDRIVHRRLMTSFATWAGVSAAALSVGAAVLTVLFNYLPPAAHSGLESAGRFLPLAAAGIALSAINLHYKRTWYVASCLLLGALSLLVEN